MLECSGLPCVCPALGQGGLSSSGAWDQVTRERGARWPASTTPSTWWEVGTESRV